MHIRSRIKQRIRKESSPRRSFSPSFATCQLTIARFSIRRSKRQHIKMRIRSRGDNLSNCGEKRSLLAEARMRFQIRKDDHEPARFRNTTHRLQSGGGTQIQRWPETCCIPATNQNNLASRAFISISLPYSPFEESRFLAEDSFTN